MKLAVAIPSYKVQNHILDVIARMKGHRAGALPIVEGGRCVGIISSGDLVTLLEKVLR